MSLGCRAVHAVPGRVRVRVEAAEVFNGFAEAFEALLTDQPGIETARLNPNCQSVVVTYDAQARTHDDIVAFLGDLSLDGVRDYSQRRSQPPAEAATGVSSWLPLALSTAASALAFFTESALAPWLLVGAAVPIFNRAFSALSQKRKLNVDVLDAAATTVLALRSQFGTAAIMVWLISLGDFIREVTVRQSHRAIEGLFDGKVMTAWLVRDGRKHRINVDEIREGDQLVVYTGELIPADGTVTRGKATVDQAFLTGESMPVEKEPGDEVYAGTAVRDGKIYLTVDHVGADTMASKIVRLVEEAPAKETRIQNYAERFADRMVPWSFLGAGACYLGLGSPNAAASVLIADYGTGIRVAAPTTVLSSMAKAARHGILVKGGGRFLERLAEVDAIVFDKTGTLTKGTPEIVDVIPYNGVPGDRILALAAAAEARLTHPVAEAIVHAARHRGLGIPERDGSDYTIGLGVEASVEGTAVLVGCRRFMAAKHIPTALADRDVLDVEAKAASMVFVSVDGELAGMLTLADPAHPEGPEVVQALKQRGVREFLMLTGDSPAVARQVAQSLGIERFVAEAFPEEKCEFVKALQREGHTVAVVGDGVNDSPALAQADVAIAVGGAADVAWEVADVVLLDKNLWKIPQAIDVARESMRLIEQNWNLNFYPVTAAIALSLPGLIGPITATLISNGAAVLATLNGLRPLMERHK